MSARPIDLDDVDDVAVYRAKHGDPVRLTRAERLVVVVELTRAGLSAAEIGRRLRVSQRTAQRGRIQAERLGLLRRAATGPAPEHGTAPAAARHRRRHEALCGACRAFELVGPVVAAVAA